MKDMRQCENCGASITRKNAQARYCSTRCRVAAHRNPIPATMTAEARWTRANGKRPVMVDGQPASSTDPATWSPFATVKNARHGDGFGVMLGDGLGCYDLDHVTDDEARTIAGQIPEPILYVERSVSGEGVHVFVAADESRGTKKWLGQHERYTRERFIRVTGNRIYL